MEVDACAMGDVRKPIRNDDERRIHGLSPTRCWKKKIS